MKKFTVGNATISVFNIGEIYLPLAKHMNVPADKFDTMQDFANLTQIPLLFAYIELPDTTILVDAGLYDVETYPEYAIEGYTPPPPLLEQLDSAGITVEQVQHVVITHRHWDHFNGTTVEKDGAYVPVFPNARYYLGEPDWTRSAELRADPTTVESRTLQVLHDRNQLELVSESLKITDGVDIIATPGETRGHQVVRVHSAGETAICVGDLYHHPVEITHPEWMVNWANPDFIIDSREAIFKRIVDENALVFAGHFHAGRLQSANDGYVWQQA